MNIKSTEISKCLNKYFYLSFIDNNHRNVDFTSFMEKSNAGIKFRLVDFVERLKECNDTFGLVPQEVLFESECSNEIIEKIELDFSKNDVSGGFTRLFLEYLFDEKFKTEFNKVIKDKSNFVEEYFLTDAKLGKFEYDLVGKYLAKIKDSYISCENKWDFSEFTERKAVRSKKDEKAKIFGTETFDNIYSAFKIFAQGEYSKMLISVLEQKKFLEPSDAESLFVESLMSAEKIKDAVPKNYQENKNLTVVESRIIERQIETAEYELQRFFEDYIPSDLDREFVLSGKNKGILLRDNLSNSFLSIDKEEWNLFKSIKCSGKESKDELYLKCTFNRNIFTESEVNFIKRMFLEKNKDEQDFSLMEKILYLKKNEDEELRRLKIWKTIFEKYLRFDPVSLQGNEDIELGGNIENKYASDGEKKVVIDIFLEKFNGEREFLSDLTSDIENFEVFDAKDFLNELKGKDGHPWARFWTIYKRYSEINLFSRQRDFTRVMNEIETEINKKL